MTASFRKVPLPRTGPGIAEVRAKLKVREAYARVADDDALRDVARAAARAAMQRIDRELGLPPC